MIPLEMCKDKKNFIILQKTEYVTEKKRYNFFCWDFELQKISSCWPDLVLTTKKEKKKKKEEWEKELVVLWILLFRQTTE